MENRCNKIQEQIAWGGSLDAQDQEHILSCRLCDQLMLEFIGIESALNEYLDVKVPDFFTENVMARIAAEGSSGAVSAFFDFASMGRVYVAYFWGAALVFFGFLLPSAG